MANCIGYVCDGDDSSDEGEPRLQICDNSDSSKETNLSITHTWIDPSSRSVSQKLSSMKDEESEAAVQSLLMLGMGEPWMSSNESSSVSGVAENNLRFSVSDDQQDQGGSNPSCYYQKMREKNNAASKRCRLKRRLKAVSLEGQLNFLSQVNEMLKDRVSQLEKISNVFRDGIKNIQPNECSCLQTVKLIKQASRSSKASNGLTTAMLLHKSKSFRDLNPESLLQSTSSDDDVRTPEVSASTSPEPQGTVSAPVLNSSLSSIVSLSSGKRAKTVLDILNDTIIKSLNSTSHTLASTVKSELLPGPSASRVKTEPDERHFLPFASPLPSSLFQMKPMFVKNEIKEEPKNIPVESCIAACMSGHCSGPLVNLNELSSSLNTITGRPFPSSAMITSGPNVLPVDRNSAMEKVIIKSRIGLPFWDETNEVCVMCGKNSSQSITFLVTQTMSRQNHAKNGRILPIGRLVCGVCKNEHFRGIDTSSSQILRAKLSDLVTTEAQKNEIRNTVLVHPSGFQTKILKRRGDSGPNHHLVLPVKIRPSPPCFSTAKNSSRVQVIIQPVQKDMQTGSKAMSNTADTAFGTYGKSDSSFCKVTRLNEALKDLNPAYNPIGFSITSIKSCSPSTLEEAVLATETAVSTLISAIAPGQEQYLWGSVKPILDEKLNSAQNCSININNNKS